MVSIDKTDELYKYLQGLGVEDIDTTYIHLAKLGRLKRSDVQLYFREMFEPSITAEVDETDLEQVLDYYIDLKHLDQLADVELNKLLKVYKQEKREELYNKIFDSVLKDVLHIACNYYSRHKDENLQDLVQTANIGLIVAIEKYDISAKISFKDYVIYWVGEAIRNEYEEKENG